MTGSFNDPGMLCCATEMLADGTMLAQQFAGRAVKCHATCALSNPTGSVKHAMSCAHIWSQGDIMLEFVSGSGSHA